MSTSADVLPPDAREISWFSDWLRRAWPGVFRILFNKKWIDLLPFLYSVAQLSAMGAFVVALIKGQRNFLFYVNDLGHLCLLVASLFFFLPRLQVGRPTVPHEQNDPADMAVSQFQNWLYGLIVLWLVFYLVRSFADLKAIYPAAGPLSSWANGALPYLNVMTALPILGLYVVLSRRSIGEPHGGMGAPTWILLGAVSMVWALEVWSQTHSDLKDLETLAGIVNGVLVGVPLAMLVGRLNSRYLGLSGSVIVFLYLYALIQPLFPYVFERGESGIRLAVQHGFVALALVMKAALILTMGKVIDNWRLHFYISNMRWLEAHAETMIAQFDSARSVDGQSRPGPPLFCFVHPSHPGAVLRFEKIDLQIKLALLNAWLGVAWDIKELKASCVTISGVEFPVKVLRLVEPGPLRVKDNSRNTFATVFVDLGVEHTELVERLLGASRIADALRLNEVNPRVSVVLKGLHANLALVEGPALQYRWTPIEQLAGGGEGLFYECTLNLAHLRLDNPATAIGFPAPLSRGATN
jgi:hypothetical protein